MMAKNRRKIFYSFFLTITIAITIYLSLLLIERGTRPRYELIASELSEENGECPCKKIGTESSHCGILFFKDSENHALNIELRPGVEQIFDGFGVCIPPTTIKINSYGFRDYEYSLSKPNNTFRIMVLGDSYTFGQGVELNETYLKVLERLLNEKKEGWRYEVLNFGVPSYNAAEKVEVLSYRGIEFNPDLVIFQYLGDDIVNWTEFRQIEKEKKQEYVQKIHRNVSELTPMEKQMVEHSIYDEYLEELEKKRFDETWKIVEKSFERLIFITQNKIDVLILANPSNDLQLSRLDEICQTYDWFLLNMDEVLYKYPAEKLIIHPKENHPTPFAHKLYAEEIYQNLIENEVLPSNT